MTKDEKEIYDTDVCAMATATNANVVIRAGGKQVFLPLEAIQLCEKKIGEGNFTMNVLIAFCSEEGEPSPIPDDGRVHFSLVARSMSKEEALSDLEN